MHVLEDKNLENIDIFNQVYNIRKERRHLVQTATQYAYVYKCILKLVEESEQDLDDDKIT